MRPFLADEKRRVHTLIIPRWFSFCVGTSPPIEQQCKSINIVCWFVYIQNQNNNMPILCVLIQDNNKLKITFTHFPRFQ